MARVKHESLAARVCAILFQLPRSLDQPARQGLLQDYACTLGPQHLLQARDIQFAIGQQQTDQRARRRDRLRFLGCVWFLLHRGFFARLALIGDEAQHDL